MGFTNDEMTTLLLGYNNLQSYRDCYSWAAHSCQVEGRANSRFHYPRQTAPSTRMSHLDVSSGLRTHKSSWDLCVLQPLDISWIWFEIEKDCHSNRKFGEKIRPFRLMCLDGFPKMFSMHRYVSSHGQTSWDTGDATGRGDKTERIVMSMRSNQLCVCKILSMHLEPRRWTCVSDLR